MKGIELIMMNAIAKILVSILRWLGFGRPRGEALRNGDCTCAHCSNLGHESAQAPGP